MNWSAQVCFHPQYPLMASSSDDGKVHIFHARVFDEYDQVRWDMS